MPRGRRSRQAAPVTRWAWLALAYASLALATIGVFLPMLPTVPFVLLAAFAASRGSRRLHRRLRNDPRFGRFVREWEEQGAVRRSAKWAATIAMAVAVVLMFLAAPRVWIAGVGTAVIVIVAAWLWKRPEPPVPTR